MTSVFRTFEGHFLDVPLGTSVDSCEHNELAAFFIKRLLNHQPVLEAGCGNGKWMHYLKRFDILATGIDWSEALQERSLRYDTAVPFDVGDLRSLPYENQSFGSILALGSIEHVVEGPSAILAEFHRVLRPGGIAIVTVPNLTPLKRFRGAVRDRSGLRDSARLRYILSKDAVRSGTRQRAYSGRYRDGIWMDLAISDGEFAFYQYVFTALQFAHELESSGFSVLNLFHFAADYGLYETSHGLLGRFDADQEVVRLNRLGARLQALIPRHLTSHMLCAVSVRPQ